MRTRLAAALVLALVLALTAPVNAVGTVVVTATSAGNITQYSIAWTSSAGGAVSANAFTVTPGEIVSVKFVPGTGGVQPTDLYDATLVDAHGVDVLNALAANLSNSVGRYFVFDPPFYFVGSRAAQTLDLSITNAGNAKSGTVVVWVRN